MNSSPVEASKKRKLSSFLEAHDAPNEGHTFGVDICGQVEYAQNTLKSATPNARSPLEIEQVKYLLGLSTCGFHHETTRSILRSLCSVAYIWHDLNLWETAMSTFDGYDSIDALGLDAVVRAFQIFGQGAFESVKILFGNELRDDLRLALLDGLDKNVSHKGMPAVSVWIAQQRENIPFLSLSSEIDNSQGCIEAFRKQGDLPISEQIVILQLVILVHPRPTEILPLIIHFSREKGGRNCDKLELTSARHFITDILSTSIKHVGLLHVSDVLPHQIDVETVVLHIEACLETGNEVLVKRILETLAFIFNDHESPLAARKDLLVALMPFANELATERHGSSLLGLDQFYRDVTPILLDTMENHELSDNEVTTLVQASVMVGLNMLEKTILPRIRRAKRSMSTYVCLIRQIRSRWFQILSDSRPTSARYLITLFDDLLQHLPSIPPKSTILEVLELAYEINEPLRCSIMLRKLVHSNSKSLPADHFEDFLPGLLPDVVSFLSRSRVGLASQPFDSFFTNFVFGWVRSVHGPRPFNLQGRISGIVKQMKCRCVSCSTVFKFFSLTDQNLLQIKVGIRSAKHLSDCLKSGNAGTIVTWTDVEGDSSGSQNFEVVKTDNFMRELNWMSNRQRCIEMIQGISSDEVLLQRIFSPGYYHNLLRHLGATRINPIPIVL